ncbi:tetratricopeptide repeat protein [bacterium]|nr:tetratricopeptide repeat protein [bacterium]MBP9807770.1 tetratricopeptide repeat protein [bacterium]
MKAFITQSITTASCLLILALTWTLPAGAQFTFSEPGSSEEKQTDSAAVYANRILKRRLQSDKRLAVHLLAKEEGGADVYASLPFQAEQLHLLLGRYQAFGQTNAPTVGPKLKGSIDDKRLAQTRFQAEQMILGNAANDVKVLDEFSSPPVAEGEGTLLNKINAVDCNLVQAFDLALAGRMADALAKQSESNKGNQKFSATAQARIENNQLCLLALSGNLDAAAATIKKGSSTSPWLQSAAKYPINMLNRANILLANKDASSALNILEKFEGNLPGRLGLALLRAKTMAYSQLGEKEKAQALVVEIVKRYPSNPGALTMAGDLAMQNENYKQAVVYLKQAASLNKASPDSLIKLAQCQSKMGDLDEAIKTATLATRDFPQSPDSHMALGKLHMDNKEFLGGRLQFERALEVSSSFAEKRQVFLPLIKVLDIMNEDKDLLKYLQQWVKQYPQEPICHYNRAFVLSEKKLVDEAIEEYIKAITLAPKYSKARYNLALLYVQKKKPQEAKAQLVRFIEDSNGAEKEQAEKLFKTL